MKKILIVLSLGVLVYSCGNGDSDKKAADSTAAPAAEAKPADITENPDYQKGTELIAQSDCLGCHKVDEKMVGPAYRDVANKYSNDEKNVEMLADKVIAGGRGVWGDIPMTPHPQLSKDDARTMVRYILLLKK
jgi:cytochrome c